MPTITYRDYRPYGVQRALFTARDPEVVLSGPAGTGKSRGCLEKLHLLAMKYDRMRGLICRKTRASLTQSALVTFDEKVRPQDDGAVFHHQDQEYRYPNGSVIVIGGLDKPSKVMSTEFDVIYPQEATELTENDWESLSTRLRNGVMPYQQLMGDCNPDAPTHWLKRRAESGRLRMLESRHEDNPTVTPEYLAKLDALTGVRYKRLRLGMWAAAEGVIYEGWDRAVHLIDRFDVLPLWPRYWAIDFGYTNPFVWQEWTADPDGRLYLMREIYRTGRLVEDFARDIKRTASGPPTAIICDHDAEDRATLERHLGLPTLPAFKSVSPGIQAVQTRLRVADDGRPRLFVMRDATVDRDSALVEAGKPARTEDEFESYVWDTRMNQRKGEAPVKEHDHGMDAMRYLVAHVDKIARSGESGSHDYRQWAQPEDDGNEYGNAPAQRPSRASRPGSASNPVTKAGGRGWGSSRRSRT